MLSDLVTYLAHSKGIAFQSITRPELMINFYGVATKMHLRVMSFGRI